MLPNQSWGASYAGTGLLAINGHPSCHRHKAIALLRAYFDETGIHDGSPMTVICGVVAPLSKWDSFDADWKKQLEVPGVPHFHAIDCEHADGVFQGIQRPLRDSLFWGLADVIGRHGIHVVNAGISAKDWKNYPIIQERFGSPFHLCFTYILQQLSKWSNEHANGEKLCLSFSQQNQYKDKAQRIFEAYISSTHEGVGLVSLQFSDMKLFPGLQAADLVCYETFKNQEAGHTQKEQVQRIGMKRLLEGDIKFISSEFSPSSLTKVIEKL
jgi:uncharacterized protein DUF3800